MNKRTFITILLAFVAMAGQGQELKNDGQSQSQIKRVTAIISVNCEYSTNLI